MYISIQYWFQWFWFNHWFLYYLWFSWILIEQRFFCPCTLCFDFAINNQAIAAPLHMFWCLRGAQTHLPRTLFAFWVCPWISGASLPSFMHLLFFYQICYKWRNYIQWRKWINMICAAPSAMIDFVLIIGSVIIIQFYLPGRLLATQILSQTWARWLIEAAEDRSYLFRALRILIE